MSLCHSSFVKNYHQNFSFPLFNNIFSKLQVQIQSLNMMRLSKKEFTCVLTCITDHTHSIVIGNKSNNKHGVFLGRADTIDPKDRRVPKTMFKVVANGEKKCFYVTLLNGVGYINGKKMRKNIRTTIVQGDLLGFSEDLVHQYIMSIELVTFAGWILLRNSH